MPLKTNLSIFIATLVILSLPTGLSAQKKPDKMVASGRNAEKIISEEKLETDIEYLTDSLFKGRGTGTRGANEAAFWLVRRFQRDSIIPIKYKGDPSKSAFDSWSQSFKAGEAAGHNIVGFMPGRRDRENKRYTIVSAHYDSFGIIDGVFYPGADCNASGVVALTSVADMFTRMKQLERSYNDNLIFVGFDGRSLNSAGSEAFWEALAAGRFIDPVSGETIKKEDIRAMVSLDILGSVLSPIHKGRKDYLLMLSGGHYMSDLRDANEGPGLGLDLAYSYYGSKSFTEMFYDRVGEQSVFVRNGIRSVVFTSGITMRTNKPDDVPMSLNYDILKKRIFLIFHWLEKMMV